MLRGIYSAASGMVFEQQTVDIIANNLANLNTTGYKRKEPVAASFKDVLVELMDQTPGTGDTIGTGVHIGQIAQDPTQGNLRQTNGPLDVAIADPGQYFVTQRSDGTNLITRDGEFYRNAAGDIVTSTGDNLLADNGQPIAVGSDIQNIKIREDGTITQNGNAIGKIMVVAPSQADLAQFPRLVTPLPPVASTNLRQGYLEASNVNAVTEMVSLLEASKLFNLEQKVVSAHDQLLQKSTQEIGKTS